MNIEYKLFYYSKNIRSLYRGLIKTIYIHGANRFSNKQVIDLFIIGKFKP